MNILFPPICPLCRAFLVDGALCTSCGDGLKVIGGPVCTHCGMPFVSGAGGDHPCGECIERPPAFVRARSALYYEGVGRDAIHLLKYSGRLTLKRPLGLLASRAAAELAKLAGDEAADGRGGGTDGAGPPFDAVLPVPLHITRLRERGFNQSLFIARVVVRELGELGELGGLGVPLDYTTLERTRPTAPQVGLKREERRKNLRGAFKVKNPDTIRGKRVLLVDDVYTTGATLAECAKVLKKAGAEVHAVTLARVASI